MEPGAHPPITVSLVSHNQGALIYNALLDLQQYCANLIEVILTINVAENLPFDCGDFTFPILLIRNDEPKGFGANHNAAFSLRKGSYFCVMNPDVRLNRNLFQIMMDRCNDYKTGVVAPLVVSTNGSVEKSARRFPTPLSIIAKIFRRERSSDYSIENGCIYVEWVAGMCMLFPAITYEKIGGFDEKYYLYYEDVDICARLWLDKYKVIFCPKVSIIHEARHESHRNIKYLKWHLFSMMRFFSRMLYWRLTGRSLVVE